MSAPTAEQTDPINALLDGGLALRAFEKALPLGSLATWRGAEGRITAGRLAAHLGDDRMANVLSGLAFREHPEHAGAAIANARVLLGSKGTLAAWEFMRRQGEPHLAAPHDLADWLAIEARMLCSVRDFARAQAELERALELDPDRDWILTERAALETARDCFDVGLERVRALLERRPSYRPARQLEAEALHRLGRSEEARAILREWSERSESAALTHQLIPLELELDDDVGAERAIARLIEVAPLLSRRLRRWLSGVRARIAHLRGDREVARAEAERAGPGYYAKIAERLALAPAGAQRVRLAVPFIAQRHLTCGPATLTAVARFWSLQIDQVELAAEICYEGTWDHVERAWAEGQGLVVQEFRVDWDCARRLIDAGVPFALTSVHPTNSHLQTVIGYDEAIGTLLVQDPTIGFTEYLCDSLLADQRSTGPRGLAFAPPAHTERLRALALPEAELYERVYRVKRALARHDRDAAEQEARVLSELAAGHPLELRTSWELAAYDRDPAGALEFVDALLALFPHNERLALAKLWLLQALGRREDRLALIELMSARAGADPTWLHASAEERRVDARDWRRAERDGRRSLRRNPSIAAAWSTLSELRLSQGRADEARELARFASCLDLTNEYLAERYWYVARLDRSADEALAHLRRRVDMLGAQSGAPALTLSRVLRRVERHDEARDILEQAIAARPSDTELALAAAEVFASCGEQHRARRLLEGVRGGAPPLPKLRVNAELAFADGDLDAAIACLRQLAAAEPFECRPQERLATVLDRRFGRTAAVEHVRVAAERVPHQLDIQKLYVQWLGDFDPVETERVLARLIDNHPADAWAYRERAIRAVSLGRFEEAANAAAEGLRVQPLASSSHATRGFVARSAGQRAEAYAAYQRAVELDIDNAHAVAAFVGTGVTDADRREAFALVKRELARQVVFGDALGAFRRAARAVASADEVLELLDDALEARPDLWQAYAEKAAHLIEIGRFDEAEKVCRAALERFPVTPDLWVRLSNAQRDPAQAAESLRRAVELAPDWIWAARELAYLEVTRGQLDIAAKVIDAARLRAPADAATAGARADLSWRTGEREAALVQLQHALRLDPTAAWSWERLGAWTRELDEVERGRQIASSLCEAFPGLPEVWLGSARLYAEGERLAAVERAVAAAPRSIEAIEALIAELCAVGRIEDARAACRPAAFVAALPWALRARAAWIDGEYGRAKDGITALKALLAEDPRALFAWEWLNEWCRRSGDHDGARAAAEWRTRVAPDDASGFASLASAQVELDQRAEAKSSLRRAVEIAPRYEWAFVALFDLHFDDNEIADARALLERFGEIERPTALIARRAMLEGRGGNRARALAELRALCTASGDDVAEIGRAYRWVAIGASNRAAGRIVADALATPRPNAAVVLWCAQRIAEKRAELWNLRTLHRLFAREGVGERAALHWTESATGVQGRVFRLEIVRRVTGGLFAASTTLWAGYGATLARFHVWRRARRWFADWAARVDATPMQLVKVAEAFRMKRDWTTAAAISARAAALPADQTSEWHRAWLALDEALAGRDAAARALLDEFDEPSAAPGTRLLLRFARALVEVRPRGEDLRGDSVRAARARLDAKQEDPLRTWSRPPYVVARRRVIAAIARRHPSARTRLWALAVRLDATVPGRS